VPVIRSIRLHPIKAFDAADVPEARVLASGAFELDRRWAFVDGCGRFVNGKNRPEVYAIRATYDLAGLEVALDGRTYSLERQKPELERWLSNRLGEPVGLLEDRDVGFPDDQDATGPTFVSASSLDLVSSWFDLPVEETGRRFRTNVEVEGTEPFWEDRLYGTAFRVADVVVRAVNPCRRCVVPSRNPRTGEAIPAFQKRFAQLREASLPAAANRTLFDHFYRFAVNTRIPASEAGKMIRLGDEVIV
jgi:uncharacterized protein YcbX